MTTTYRPSVSDKAEALLANSATWLRLRCRETGRIIAYGVPSLTVAGKFHRTNGKACDCQAAQNGRDCSHRQAAEAYVRERRAGTPAPAPVAVVAQPTYTAEMYEDDQDALFGAA